ncbi:MAG: hypothetical protein JO341_01030 [Gammaproteobacteria bacterium]|nr:hypothetical protein [Gammaproteobacteria bacterium]
MWPLLGAALAIVAQDPAALRATPHATARELTALWAGEVVEVRDECAEYLKVYDYRLERGGYVLATAVRRIGLTQADAPELLAVVRFLRDSPGQESLGISYGAAYLRAAAPGALTAEPLAAIAAMAERLADAESRRGAGTSRSAHHVEVAEQFGIHMRSIDIQGRMQVCYDGELYRRVLAMPGASNEEVVRALLSLTRPECNAPDPNGLQRSLDADNADLLQRTAEPRDPVLRSRLQARRALLWAAVAYASASDPQHAQAAARHALDALLEVRAEDLGDAYRAEYLEARLRVGSIRWALALPDFIPPAAPLRIERGAPGQTCLALTDAALPAGPGSRRCTYGAVWIASSQRLAGGRGWTIAVQPLQGWRELWVFHAGERGDWTVDVVPPGDADAEEGYVEFAGFAPRTQRLLIAREIKQGGRFQRRYEELRLSDLVRVRQSRSPELLADFGRWPDARWVRDTLLLH